MKGKYADYHNKYAKEKLKRIPLDVRIEEYEEIRAAAEKSGEPVTTFIKKSIRNRIERIKTVSLQGEE